MVLALLLAVMLPASALASNLIAPGVGAAEAGMMGSRALAGNITANSSANTILATVKQAAVMKLFPLMPSPPCRSQWIHGKSCFYPLVTATQRSDLLPF